MTFQINQGVSFNGKGTIEGVTVGTKGIVRAFTTIDETQYIKVFFTTGVQHDDAYPADWFDPAPFQANVDSISQKQFDDVHLPMQAPVGMVHFFQIKIDYHIFMDQVRLRGEWEVKKDMHSALDNLIEEIKKGPHKLPPGDAINDAAK